MVIITHLNCSFNTEIEKPGWKKYKLKYKVENHTCIYLWKIEIFCNCLRQSTRGFYLHIFRQLRMIPVSHRASLRRSTLRTVCFRSWEARYIRLDKLATFDASNQGDRVIRSLPRGAMCTVITFMTREHVNIDWDVLRRLFIATLNRPHHGTCGYYAMRYHALLLLVREFVAYVAALMTRILRNIGCLSLYVG